MGEKNKDKESVEERLRKRANEGAGNVIESLLKQPQIKRILLLQSIETGFFLSALMVGVFTVINALKTIFNLNLLLDLFVGLALITLFIIYVVLKIK